jgi:uncharacterized BrkB/YihY/UPF0761 family membrane protein
MDPKHWRHHRLRSLVSFWIKISNDWIFNLAGVLAYNLLLSVFPILLLLLAITSFALDGLSPGSQMRLQSILQQALPEGTATNLLYHVTITLHHSAPLLLVIGLIFALINGSNLFVVLENCLGIVFKLRGRNPIRQRLMMNEGMLTPPTSPTAAPATAQADVHSASCTRGVSAKIRR